MKNAMNIQTFLPAKRWTDGLIIIEINGRVHLHICFSKEQCLQIIKNYGQPDPEELTKFEQQFLGSEINLPAQSPRQPICITSIVAQEVNNLAHLLKGQALQDLAENEKLLLTPRPKLSDQDELDGALVVKDTSLQIYIFYSQAQAMEVVLTYRRLFSKTEFGAFIKSINFSCLPLQSASQIIHIDGGFGALALFNTLFRGD